jgi:hypothetical protein
MKKLNICACGFCYLKVIPLIRKKPKISSAILYILFIIELNVTAVFTIIGNYFVTEKIGKFYNANAP